MIQYILGNYFVSKGKLSKEALQTVLEKQDKTRVKLGLIAVEEGLITKEQASEINRLQASLDKRFGDIAIEKEYLTSDQVGRLLLLQGNAYLVFLQNLVDEGFMTTKDVEDCVLEYQKEKGYSLSEMEVLKSGNIDRILPLYLPGDTAKYANIVGVAIRTLIRCIDRNVYIDEASKNENITIEKSVLQTVQGEEGYVSAFVEETGGMSSLASIFAKENYDKVDEDVLDAAGEFLNCINGLHASDCSYRSISLELDPPSYHLDSTMIEGKNICSIPIYIQGKKMLFVVSKD